MDRATTRPLRAIAHRFRPVVREHAVGEDCVAVVLRGGTAMRPTPSAAITRRDGSIVGEVAARVARRDAEHGTGAAPGPAVGVVASRQCAIARKAAVGEVELRAALGVDRATAVVARSLRGIVGEGAVGEVARAASEPDRAAIRGIGSAANKRGTRNRKRRSRARGDGTAGVAADAVLEAAAGDRQPSACDCPNRSTEVRRRRITHDRVDDAEAAGFVENEAAVGLVRTAWPSVELPIEATAIKR